MSGPTIGSIPVKCLPFLEFLEASLHSRKHGLEEKEIPETLRPDDVVVWCKAQRLIDVERLAPSLRGVPSAYSIRDRCSVLAVSV